MQRDHNGEPKTMIMTTLRSGTPISEYFASGALLMLLHS